MSSAEPAAPDPRRDSLRREMLLAGISDTQGTIHANDAKCSAALITHGLLFAGLVTVSANVADLYPEVADWQKIAAVILAAFALLAAATSILHLLWAVRPYRPSELVDAISSEARDAPGIFYPNAGTKEAAIDEQQGRVQRLDEALAIRDLTYEAVKLGAIRNHEATYAKRGYTWLIVEVVVVVAYLAVVAGAAIQTV